MVNFCVFQISTQREKKISYATMSLPTECKTKRKAEEITNTEDPQTTANQKMRKIKTPTKLETSLNQAETLVESFQHHYKRAVEDAKKYLEIMEPMCKASPCEKAENLAAAHLHGWKGVSAGYCEDCVNGSFYGDMINSHTILIDGGQCSSCTILEGEHHKLLQRKGLGGGSNVKYIEKLKRYVAEHKQSNEYDEMYNELIQEQMTEDKDPILQPYMEGEVLGSIVCARRIVEKDLLEFSY